MAIIDSGAVAGVTAESLLQAGLNVVIVQEGSLKSSSGFNQQAAQALAPCFDQAEPIAALPLEPFLMKLVSAHVRGGGAAVSDQPRGVVCADAVHWHIENVSVHDGSIFPACIGPKPQLSIYGVAGRLAQDLARRVSAHEVVLA